MLSCHTQISDGHTRERLKHPYIPTRLQYSLAFARRDAKGHDRTRQLQPSVRAYSRRDSKKFRSDSLTTAHHVLRLVLLLSRYGPPLGFAHITAVHLGGERKRPTALDATSFS